ncbi:MAG: NusG domain II-containing protein [Roseburia sp.]|nr:NusG domain II-containing protein [Roseburia sp.]
MKKDKVLLKGDLLLFTGILLLAAFMAFMLGRQDKQPGKYLRIIIDGELYGEYSLEADRKILVQEVYGSNDVVIQEGTVFVEEADCPDKYCVKHHAIDRVNETIVCLPHRLVLEITAKQPNPIRQGEEQIDGVVQ